MVSNVSQDPSYFLDRGHWPPVDLGWGSEPDYLTWTDEATKLPCVARRGLSGAWCGYVGLPPSHPLHGQDRDAVEVDVHGGLTYSEECQVEAVIIEGMSVPAVCHEVPPGEDDDFWWFGFDCSHWNDYMPALKGRMMQAAQESNDPKVKELFGHDEWDGEYRTLDYVMSECVHLAKQLSDYEPREEAS